MWLMLGLFVVAGGAGQLAARQLVRPIAEVTAAARLLTAGQLGSRALVQDTNELALLATAFNEMAAAVEQRTRERQESEDRLHVLVETVQVGVVVHDAQSRIQVCNPTARRLLDLSVTDSLSKSADDPAWKFVRADGTPMPSGEYPVNQVLATRHPLRDCVVGILTADSCVPQWVLVNADPVFDAQCQLAQVIVAFIDITERKLAENALREKTAEMESFTYKVTHDLKSPLVTIKTFLGFLEKDLAPPISAPVIKDLGYINKAADKMGTLLEELLKFAHAGINGNAHEEVPFQEIVEEALSLVAGQIAARGVQIDVSKEPVWLYGDRVRLVEVFQNLVDNAVKFLIDQPVPRIEIGIEAVGGELQIFVRDNGRGIDEKYQSKVFGLFEKLDVSISGSGLGLALVRRIVELHGGKIWVESAGLGQGTTFRFTLANTRGPQP
jgi:signal transduction histidine kinase